MHCITCRTDLQQEDIVTIIAAVVVAAKASFRYSSWLAARPAAGLRGCSGPRCREGVVVKGPTREP
jgi:hypothetical protein